MSAVLAVQGAMVSALRSGLGTQVSGVFDGAPARAAFPFVEIGDGEERDWSHKTGLGREIRLGVLVRDDGRSSARLQGLMGDVQDAVLGMARELHGFRVVSLVFVRSRVARDGAGGPWAGLVEFRARVLAG
ncbi:DUF3168 domain-containing protein [Sphingomonas sp. ID0503]|uniref:DUF3168 domain-containing protein n=1 Tax=Sphingomonas sp. ID0503 TaxID=3399691 RepID=UPI003AFAFFE6